MVLFQILIFLIFMMLHKEKYTIFCCGEGSTEGVFLAYLKKLYINKKLTSMIVRSAKGGCPRNILNKAIDKRKNASYDVSFILVDQDRLWPDLLINEARRYNFKLIWSRPRIEGLFFKILGKPVPDKCKSKFWKKYLPEADSRKIQRFSRKCTSLFPKKVLDSARRRVRKLDQIIQIIERTKNN